MRCCLWRRQEKLNRISTPHIDEQLRERREKRQRERDDAERQRLVSGRKTTWVRTSSTSYMRTVLCRAEASYNHFKCISMLFCPCEVAF